MLKQVRADHDPRYAATAFGRFRRSSFWIPDAAFYGGVGLYLKKTASSTALSAHIHEIKGL